MHEFSIAEALVEAAVSTAHGAAMRRVAKVVCRIGVLRQVEESLHVDAFRIAGENTLCANAVLQVETTHIRARCPDCKRDSSVREWVWICPACGATGTDGHGGDELDLMSIEGETDDDQTADWGAA